MEDPKASDKEHGEEQESHSTRHLKEAHRTKEEFDDSELPDNAEDPASD